jgi:hypothetical protein
VGGDAAKAPEYFIGSIVVCPGKEGVLDLIDGQQRMTTLFLTLCAIRDRIRELNEKPPGALEPQIAATSTDASGRDHFRYRLDLQYEDSGDVVVRIAKGKPRSGDGVITRSIANILNAYAVALGFLTREFGDDVDALRAFYGYLTDKVKLIRIQTEDVAKALKIFRDDQRPWCGSRLNGSLEEPPLHEGQSRTVRHAQEYLERAARHDFQHR